MENYMDAGIIIPILIFIAAALLYYLYHKMKEKQPPKDKVVAEGDTKSSTSQTYEAIYAQVFDNTLVVPRWYWSMIPGVIVSEIIKNYKTLGIQQDTDDNKKAYQLVRLGKYDFKPVSYPTLEADNPVELNYDTEHPEYELILSTLLREEKSFMQKYGQVLWWAAVIAFIIFMTVSG